MNLFKILYYFELSKITKTFVTEISGESQNKLLRMYMQYVDEKEHQHVIKGIILLNNP